MGKTVELVIRLPEELVDQIRNSFIDETGITTTDIVYIAIKNGTSLPKGHGPLKDTSKFVYNCSYSEYGCDIICRCDNCVHHVIEESDINDAPTVVAADKEERI